MLKCNRYTCYDQILVICFKYTFAFTPTYFKVYKSIMFSFFQNLYILFLIINLS